MAIGNHTSYIIIKHSNEALTEAITEAKDSRRSLQFITMEAAMLYYKKFAPNPDAWQIVTVPN